MSDDFCRAVRQALPEIAQSVVTAMEDELADCRTRLAEVEAENGRLRGALEPARTQLLRTDPRRVSTAATIALLDAALRAEQSADAGGERGGG